MASGNSLPQVWYMLRTPSEKKDSHMYETRSMWKENVTLNKITELATSSWSPVRLTVLSLR